MDADEEVRRLTVGAAARLAACDGPDEVAALIAADGVTGIPGVADMCPLALWVDRRIGQPEGLAVTVFTYIMVHPWRGRRADFRPYKLPLPAPAKKFLWAFDRQGAYPGLRMRRPAAGNPEWNGESAPRDRMKAAREDAGEEG